jgi:hypothetical protein
VRFLLGLPVSLLLLASGWVKPTWLGELFVLLQAAAVGVFAYLEYGGLRRERARVVGEHLGEATPRRS